MSIIVFIKFIPILLFYLIHSNKFATGEDLISKFVVSIWQKEASNCGIFFIRKFRESEGEDGLIGEIVKNQIVPYYSAYYVDGVGRNESLIPHYPPRANFMMKSSICKLVVVIMGHRDDGEGEFLAEIEK